MDLKPRSRSTSGRHSWRKARIALRLSQAHVANLAGIHQSLVSDVELGVASPEATRKVRAVMLTELSIRRHPDMAGIYRAEVQADCNPSLRES